MTTLELLDLIDKAIESYEESETERKAQHRAFILLQNSKREK